MNTPEQENAKQQAEKLYKNVKKLVVCATDSEGYPTAKAVLPAKIRENLKEVYIVTNTHSQFVTDILRDNKSSVYFFDPIMFKGCLLKGTTEIVSDIKVKESLWKNGYKGAYPEPEKTFNDPDFCVLKFTAQTGRFYYMFKQYNFEI